MQVLRRAYITPARRSLHELYVCAFLVVSVRALSPRAVPCCLRVLTAYSFMSGDARRMFCGKMHAQRRVYRACIMAAVRLENVRDLPQINPLEREVDGGAHIFRASPRRRPRTKMTATRTEVCTAIKYARRIPSVSCDCVLSRPRGSSARRRSTCSSSSARSAASRPEKRRRIACAPPRPTCSSRTTC